MVHMTKDCRLPAEPRRTILQIALFFGFFIQIIFIE